jgi:hypothetical protein
MESDQGVLVMDNKKQPFHKLPDTRIELHNPGYNDESTVGKLIDDFKSQLPHSSISVFATIPLIRQLRRLEL